MSSKLYWHSDTAQGPVASALTLDSRHAAPGAVGLGADWKQREDERARTASGWASLPDTAVGQGDYTLPAGSLTIPLGALLPALKVTAPTTMGGINPAEGLMVTWEPVPGARGYLVSALAIGGAIGSDKFSVVRWVSSTIQPPERAQRQYEPATTIADDVAAGILLPPTAVSCQIPAGIFPELGSLGSFSLTVVAVGDDFSEDRRGVALRGRIRSTWSGLEVAPRQGTGTSAPAPPAPGMPLPGVSG
jgi:hypothetical protein